MNAKDYTYEKFYGQKNVDRRQPLVSAGGFYWMTKGGIPVVYPDQFIGEDNFPLDPLPSGTVAVEMTTGNKVTVP